MKRKWLGGLSCLICFFVSMFFWLNASAIDVYNYNDCINVRDGAYKEIDSVRWACDSKFNGEHAYDSFNYCAMWIGEVANSASTEVVINVDSDGLNNSAKPMKVSVAFWGMCIVGNSATCAADISVDNNAVENPKQFMRGPWGWPEKKIVSLDVKEFMKTATCSDNAGGAMCNGSMEGERVYKADITVGRRFGGSNCVAEGGRQYEEVPFTVRINVKDDAKYYSQSNVAAARRDDTEYVTTGITDKTTTVTAEKTDVYVGDVVNLIFSHNVFSDREKNGVSWRMVRDTPLENCGNEGSYVFLECNKGKNKEDSTDFDIEYNDVRYGLGRIYVPERTYSDGTYKFITRDTYKLKFTKPGTYTFCETMKVPDGTEMTTACAKYVVSAGVCDRWVPSSYYKGVTSVVSKVKYYGASDDEYTEEIYAKPKYVKNGSSVSGDKFEWLHCYYPGAQMNSQTALSLGERGNSFVVTTDNLGREVFAQNDDAKKIGNYRSGTIEFDRYNGGTYYLGDSDIRYLIDKRNRSNTDFEGFEIVQGDVGKTLKEINTYNVLKSIDASNARILVPYNFENTIEIMLNGNEDVFAGETVGINSIGISVGERENKTLKDTYTTKVKNPKVKLVSYVPNGSEGITEDTEVGEDICSAINGTGCSSFDYKINKSELEPGRWVYQSIKTTLVVPDSEAGTQLCVVAAIYPSSSGTTDTQMNPEGSRLWRVSKPSCVKIAKKPSLQIWGGGLYSNGKVSTSVAKKRDLKGGDLKGKVAVFGSWAETSIVSNGMINGLASGAATGYPNSSDEAGGSLEDPESDSTAFCDIRSPMTIPSSACGSGSISDIMNSGGLPFGNTGGVEESELEKRVAEILAKLENIDSSVVNLEKTDGDYIISENITISDGGYSSIAEIPKNIFVAKNIYINCNVTRIDAILIAEGVVKTCADVDDSDVDNESRLTQLKINGMIIADSFVPGRTYGASTGRYSTIPAEIINYDSSIYFLGLFDSNGGGGSSSKDLETVYVQELPPRL